MSRLLFILFFFLGFSGFCQDLRVIDMNRDFEKVRTPTNFDFVHPDFDSTKMTWVADLRVDFDTVIRGVIGECFKVLKERANRYGANSFTVMESDIYSFRDEKYINISVYWIRMENRDENLKLQRDNKVYLFGFLGYHDEINGYDVQINEEEFIMRSLSYRVYEFEKGDLVQLQLGSSIRGTTETIRIEKNMYPRFFNFHMITGSFKNAWIGEYDLAYGQFLSYILKESKTST